MRRNGNGLLLLFLYVQIFSEITSNDNLNVTSSVAMETENVPLSETDVLLPETDVLVQETDTNPLPETENIPLSETDVPLSETDVPVSETDVPLLETDVPLPETDKTPLPETENIPLSETEVPLPETDNVPVSETDVPPLETDVPLPENDKTPLPETENIPLSETEVPLPETDNVPVSETDIPLSESDVPLPETDNVPQPETDNVPLPETGDPLPETTPSVDKMTSVDSTTAQAAGVLGDPSSTTQSAVSTTRFSLADYFEVAVESVECKNGTTITLHLVVPGWTQFEPYLQLHRNHRECFPRKEAWHVGFKYIFLIPSVTACGTTMVQPNVYQNTVVVPASRFGIETGIEERLVFTCAVSSALTSLHGAGMDFSYKAVDNTTSSNIPSTSVIYVQFSRSPQNSLVKILYVIALILQNCLFDSDIL